MNGKKQANSRDEVLPAKGKIRSLSRIHHYLRPYRVHIFFAFVALVFTSSAVLGMGGALKYLIDEGITKRDIHLLNQSFVILLGVTMLLALATYVRYYLMSWIGESVVADIRRDVFRHVVHLHTGFFESNRTGELLSRITTDTTLLQTVVGSSVSLALRNTLLFLGGSFMLAHTSGRLTLYVSIIVPLVVVPIVVIGKQVRKLSRITQNKVADISAQAEEALSSIRTVHAFSLEDFETQRFTGLVDATRKAALSRIRLRAALTGMVIAFVFSSIVTVLWIGGRDVIHGELTSGALSAFIFYSVVVAGAIGAISEVVGDLQRAAGAAERLMELLAEKPAIHSPASPVAMPAPLTGRIAFEQVTFNYPTRPDRSALHNFNLTVEPGETLALVGPSGAGKTTILQLLLRFYDPQSGRISIDGVNIADLDLKALRSHMGIVQQDPIIFSQDAWYNIRCGRPEATAKEVIMAAQAAEALEFLEKLPDGLDTHLGEKGVRLSGGQRQRIAIARAMIRNPRILLLDEATSALDAENERKVQQALTRIMQGRTTLVIAHRLATVKNADRIAVINEGKLEAVGTHDQLLMNSPLYAHLASLQFRAA